MSKVSHLKFGITGGTGSIGSQLIRKLLTHSGLEKINVLANKLETREKDRLCVSDPRVFPVQGDFLKNVLTPLTELVKQSDAVIHLAGWNSLGDVSPTKAVALNTLSTALLSQLCRDSGIRMIFSSSVYVYQLGQYKCDAVSEKDLNFSNDISEWLEKSRQEVERYVYSVIKSENRPSPLDFSSELLKRFPLPASINNGMKLYALTNLLAEYFVLNNPNGISLRFSNVYGPGDETERVVPKMLRQMSASDEPVKFIPDRLYSLIYVDDVVDAIVSASSTPVKPNQNQVVNVCHPETVTHKQLLEKIRRAANKSSIQILPYSPDELSKLNIPTPKPIIFKTVKMETELKLDPKKLVSLDAGLIETKKWLFEKNEREKWVLLKPTLNRQ